MSKIIAFLLTASTALAGAADAVVRCQTSEAMYSGSVISDEFVLTAKHCVRGEEQLPIQVRFRDGTTVKGKAYAWAKETEGPALIKIPKGNYETIKIAERLPAVKSIHVLAAGYPQGTYTCMSVGGHLQPAAGYMPGDRHGGMAFVNSMNRPLAQGYSGGPILNDDHEIVGVISASDATTSLHCTHSDIVRFVNIYCPPSEQPGRPTPVPVKPVNPTRPRPREEGGACGPQRPTQPVPSPGSIGPQGPQGERGPAGQDADPKLVAALLRVQELSSELTKRNTEEIVELRTQLREVLIELKTSRDSKKDCDEDAIADKVLDRMPVSASVPSAATVTVDVEAIANSVTARVLAKMPHPCDENAIKEAVVKELTTSWKRTEAKPTPVENASPVPSTGTTPMKIYYDIIPLETGP